MPAWIALYLLVPALQGLGWLVFVLFACFFVASAVKQVIEAYWSARLTYQLRLSEHEAKQPTPVW